MPHWEEMQVKAKVLMEEALKVLKAGMGDAEMIAGKTAAAARLHMQTRRSRIEKYRILHELGDLLYEKYETSSQPGQIELTKHMKDLLGQTRNLDQVIEGCEKKLNKFSITKKAPPKARKQPGAIGPKKNP